MNHEGKNFFYPYPDNLNQKVGLKVLRADAFGIVYLFITQATHCFNPCRDRKGMQSFLGKGEKSLTEEDWEGRSVKMWLQH